MRRISEVVLLPLLLAACGGVSLRSEADGEAGAAGEGGSAGTTRGTGGTRAGSGGSGNAPPLASGGFGSIGAGATGGSTAGTTGKVTGGAGGYGAYGGYGGDAGSGPLAGSGGTVAGYGGDAGSGSLGGGGFGAGGGAIGGSGGSGGVTYDPTCPAKLPQGNSSCDELAQRCAYQQYNDCLCTQQSGLFCYSTLDCSEIDEGEGGSAGLADDGQLGGAAGAPLAGAAREATAPPGVATCECTESGWLCSGPGF
jgi:hypothetical protein